jgi:phage terminase large subunit
MIEIPTAKVFEPLLQPGFRYYAAHGGRGSGKSWHFASAIVERCLLEPGLRVVCAREFQKTLAESAKRLIEDQIGRLGVGAHFQIFHDRIVTPGDGSIHFWGLSDKGAESIKSLEGVDMVWLEEAQTISQRSLSLLRPTIRKEGSVIAATWNPRRKTDAIDVFLRQDKPENAVVVEANWETNPWFPDVLHEERLLDRERDPLAYDHIWCGGYAAAVAGAYFGDLIADARREGRVTRLAIDPMLSLHAFWDIGVADATAIWMVQFVGGVVNVLDYIEGTGQPLSYYTNELRSRGYKQAICTLPHDGVTRNTITGQRFEDHLRDAGFSTTIVRNQGAGAARMRIEAVRRVFPKCYFDEEKCEAGIEALAWYHERVDEHRDIGLGPLHDWSSHAADAFGLMAISQPDPAVDRVFSRSIKYPRLGAI